MKTKIILLAFFLSISTVATYAQEEIYSKHFTTKGTWPVATSSDRSLEVKNGKYYFEHFRDDKNWNVRTSEINIDTNKDFEIEMSFQKISGSKTNATGLMYGAIGRDNTYHFVLSKDQYRVSEKKDGTFKTIKAWTTSSSIKTGYYAYNKLKVVKKGSSMYYYINGTLVTTQSFKPFFGKKIGILVYNKQKVAVDYFKVKQGKSTTTQSKTILFEGFNNNNNNWSHKDDANATFKVSGGNYILEHKSVTSTWSSTIEKKFDTSRDFRISAQIKKVNGVLNHGYGLVFGRKDTKNRNSFLVSGNGSYTIIKYENNQSTIVKKWTKSSHIKTGSGVFNTLTVRKKGSKTEYLINSKIVYTSYTTKIYGYQIGFSANNKQTVSIAYLSMAYLDVKKKVTNTTTSSTVIWEDDFTTNKNNWTTNNSDTSELVVKSNKYYIDHKKTKGGFTSTKEINIDTSKDFEIESKFLKISGISNHGYGFVFGRKDDLNKFIFIINSNGSYTIGQNKDSKYISLKDWTKSSAIKTGNYAYNTLKIKKERCFIKFYVNNSYLTLYTHKPFMGKHLGFMVYNNQKIAIDNFKVTYINQKDTKKNTPTIATGDTVIADYFTDNKNNWPLGNTSDKKTDVANSYYNFEHLKDSGGWAINIPKTIDTSRDFEIVTNIKKISGVTNYSYGFQWGKEGKNSFRFYLTGNGYYKIVRVVNNKEEIIKKFVKSSHIKTGNGVLNRLKIRKEGDHYKFYVNNKYLTQTNFESFYGHRLGYVVFNKQKIGVDNITIKYLKKATNTIVTTNTLKVPLYEGFTNNNNGWNLTDLTNVKSSISNGKLYLKSNTEKGGAFISKKIDVDTSRDFIIETSITRLTSGSSGSVAFSFGRKNNTNQFDLFLSKGGSYLLRKLENDTSNKLIPWTSTTTLKTSSHQENRIKIIKSGKLLRIYINGQYINEAPYSPFFGNYMGFSVYKKQEISINYLNIIYPAASFNTPPAVVITEPTVQRGFKIVKTKRILVKGIATDKDGIYEIIVNGIEATVLENGTFTANVPLKIGTNDLIVKATDLKQASSTKTFTIKRKSPDVIVDPIVVTKDKKIDTGFGKYYALLIGVSDYGDGAITGLEGLPTKDAKDLGNVLIDNYNFKRENVVFLNNNPKANDIIKEFSKLKKKVTDKDNVLIFYAGHGVYDETNRIGYWLPSDADMEFDLNLISNSQIADFIRSIKSKHTLLISDACFSGSIFSDQRSLERSPKSIQKKYELKSRRAITSGALKTVPNKSVFLEYLLDRLKNNKNLYMSAGQLFNRIEEAVMNNSPSTPLHKAIYRVGDEGGDFIFIKN